MLNEEFDVIHWLDKFDVTISVAAGFLGAAVDILLVGFPQKSSDGLNDTKKIGFCIQKIERYTTMW